MTRLSNIILNWLFDELQKRDAILLPLRLFIGLGWARAGVEKLIDAQWLSGASLQDYLQTQITAGVVAFPFYESAMTVIFEQYAYGLSLVIAVGELCAGLAIIFGFLTRTALFAGLFMNLNFILSGTVSPSAFYIIIQMVLLPSNVGKVLSVDSVLDKIQTKTTENSGQNIATIQQKRNLFFGGSILCVLLTIVTAPFVQTLDPKHSIEDPAMLLIILLCLLNVLCLTLGMHTVKQLQVLSNRETLPVYTSSSIHMNVPNNLYLSQEQT